MFQVPLVTSTTTVTATSFWDVVLLYHSRPHLINRKLLVASQVLFCKVSFHSKDVKHLAEIFTRTAILYEIGKLKPLTKEKISENFLREFLVCYDKSVTLMPSTLDDFREEKCNGLFISVRILMPRKSIIGDCLEIVILNKDENTATFLAVSEDNTHSPAPPFPYTIELTRSNNLRIGLQSFEDADTIHAEWIADKMFPKFIKWSNCGIDLSNTSSSLSLISVHEYCITYGKLKSKYGQDLRKEWPKKTNTDPKKYIYEDLAIASYLICLWKKYNQCDINFVDCGCGNGLLVYILNKEGYKGYGIDIRRRSIWDIYPKNIRLEVGTVTPSSVFPDSTWIIGNHSDELTPWIPIIAMKSSPHTNIFVIPCCPYDFSGQKYARTNTSVSQYSDYFDYIENIYKMCGYETKTDKLRIPSTKRKCLMGIRKNLAQNELNKITSEISTFIDSRLSVSNFKARAGVESVKNCTQLNRDIVQRLVFDCVSNLLKLQNYIKKVTGEEWNKGGKMSISDLSQLLTRGDLKQLKEQCGGLQTLLRNHRYLFEVYKGEVSLREPPLLSEDTKKYKDKICWFLKNHPNGCLHSSQDCSYNHEV